MDIESVVRELRVARVKFVELTEAYADAEKNSDELRERLQLAHRWLEKWGQVVEELEMKIGGNNGN